VQIDATGLAKKDSAPAARDLSRMVGPARRYVHVDDVGCICMQDNNYLQVYNVTSSTRGTMAEARAGTY